MGYKTKEQQKEYNRLYWQRNKERIKSKRKSTTEYMRKWRESNREKYNAYARAYRAKQKNNGIEKEDKNEQANVY